MTVPNFSWLLNGNNIKKEDNELLLQITSAVRIYLRADIRYQNDKERSNTHCRISDWTKKSFKNIDAFRQLIGKAKGCRKILNNDHDGGEHGRGKRYHKAITKT